MNFRFGIEPAQAETHRPLQPIGRHVHRPQHMRRLSGAGRASRAGGSADPLLVQQNQNRLAFQITKTDVQGIRQRSWLRPLTRLSGQRLPATRLPSDRAICRSHVHYPRRCDPGRFRRLCPCRQSPATFSVPARRLRSWWPPIINGGKVMPRRTYSAPTPFGCMKFMAGYRQQIDRQLFDVNRNLPGRLNGVDMERNAVGHGPSRQSFRWEKSRRSHCSPT